MQYEKDAALHAAQALERRAAQAVEAERRQALEGSAKDKAKAKVEEQRIKAAEKRDAEEKKRAEERSQEAKWAEEKVREAHDEARVGLWSLSTRGVSLQRWDELLLLSQRGPCEPLRVCVFAF